MKFLDLPSSLTYVGAGAFACCEELESIYLPKNFGSLFCSDPFSQSGIKYVSFEEGYETIPETLFGFCYELENITIPDTVKSIGKYAFYDCISMKSITIPKSVEVIDNRAIGYYFDDYTDDVQKLPGFKIYCYKGTAGEKYAKENGFDYEVLDGCKVHSFTDWDVTVPATCTENGEQQRICTVCGEIEIDVIPATGHSFGTWEISTPATCTENGELQRKCENCGAIETEIIHATGHTYSNEWTIDAEPTCTEAGSKSHHCVNCDAKTDITEIPATGHSFGAWMVTSPATCTENGEKQHKCENCGAIETEIIPATGHTCSSQWTVDVPATCTEAGSKSHHCVNCDAKTDITEIPATGHSFGAWKVTSPATCTENGEKQHKCENCGAIETEIISATGHTYSSQWTVDVPATCTEAGYKSHHCVNCDAKTDVTEIPAKGHTFVDKVVKPTYTAKGYTLHTCSVCGYSYKDSETPKLVLAKVTGFKASDKSDSYITLKWNKSSAATGYIIEQYKSGKWVRIAKLTKNTTTSYKVPKLTASTRYVFRIQAYKDIGSGAVKSAYTDKLAVYTNPKSVSGFRVSAKSDSTITLAWAKNTSATGYILEQYKGNKWVRIAKITKNSTTAYKVTGLSASNRYVFRIQAYKEFDSGAVKSAYTDKLSAYTNPKAVTGFKAKARTKNTITLSWNKNTSATGYIIERYKNNKWVKIKTITSNSTTSYKVTGLSANTRYTFRIQAYKDIPNYGTLKSTYSNKLVVYTTVR